MFDITLAICSDRGQRSANEDAVRVGRSGARQYAVLSDGAGGHERGAQASHQVVEHIEAALGAPTLSFTPAHLSAIVLSAHAELQRAQMNARGRGRMHATVVVLWIDTRSDRALWSHVGDSRLYRFRYGAVDQVTADDSVVQRMLEGGVLTPRQAQDHPMKNQLLAAVGMQDSVEPHTLPTAAPLEDGDAFLLCSDGWWGGLSDAEMATSLIDAATAQGWLDAMRRLIEARGGPGQDNFSAVALWVIDPAESTQSMNDVEPTGLSASSGSGSGSGA